MILTHGQIVLARAEPETRAHGLLAIPPRAFVVVETAERGTLEMQAIDLDHLRALRPDAYATLMAELRAARDAQPIKTGD